MDVWLEIRPCLLIRMYKVSKITQSMRIGLDVKSNYAYFMCNIDKITERPTWKLFYALGIPWRRICMIKHLGLLACCIEKQRFKGTSCKKD